jgi:hypothetical protein
MTFAYPYAFLLALPLAFAAWRMLRRARGRGVRFSAVSRLNVKSSGWRVIVATIAPYVAILGLALLVVAAAFVMTAQMKFWIFIELGLVALTLAINIVPILKFARALLSGVFKRFKK